MFRRFPDSASPDRVHAGDRGLRPALAGPPPAAHHHRGPLHQLLLPWQPQQLPLRRPRVAPVARWESEDTRVQTMEKNLKAVVIIKISALLSCRTRPDCVRPSRRPEISRLPEGSAQTGHRHRQHAAEATAETAGLLQSSQKRSVSPPSSFERWKVEIWGNKLTKTPNIILHVFVIHSTPSPSVSSVAGRRSCASSLIHDLATTQIKLIIV